MALLSQGRRAMMQPLLSQGRRAMMQRRVAFGLRYAHALPQDCVFLRAGAGVDDPASRELESGSTPLVLMLGWVGTKERIARKYAQIYQANGFDVVALLSRPKHVVFPVARGRGTAKRLLSALRSPEGRDRPVVVAGFSVGAYMFGNFLLELDALATRGTSGLRSTGELAVGAARTGAELRAAAEDARQVGGRFRGAIFDSPVDFTGIPFGLSRAVTNSEGTAAQRALEFAINAYLYGPLYGFTTVHYKASSDIFKRNYLSLPSLWLFSDGDTVSTPGEIRAVSARWSTPDGAAPEEVEFEGTPHVQHLPGHTAAYTDAVTRALGRFMS